MNIKEEFQRRIDSDKDIGNFLPLLHDKTLDYMEPEILEFGTWEGSSTLAFLNAIEEVGGHLTSVDNRHYPIMERLSDNNNVTFIVKDSREFTSNKTYDIILVDSEHSYNQVRAECKVIKDLIREGTRIFFHDIVFKPEILPAIKEFTDSINCKIKSYNEHYGMMEVEVLE